MDSKLSIASFKSKRERDGLSKKFLKIIKTKNQIQCDTLGENYKNFPRPTNFICIVQWGQHVLGSVLWDNFFFVKFLLSLIRPKRSTDQFCQYGDYLGHFIAKMFPYIEKPDLKYVFCRLSSHYKNILSLYPKIFGIFITFFIQCVWLGASLTNMHIGWTGYIM